MKDPKTYIRKNILALTPYSTARDEYQGEIGIYLDANENPYDNGYNRYPDPHQKELKAELSKIKDIPSENIFIGNGSDEPIDLIFRIFCTPGVDNAVSIAPSYGMYKVAAATNDVALTEVRLETDFSLDNNKLLAACNSNTKVIFLCSPNNPSGNNIPRAQIIKIVEKFDGIVVVDEAYIDFSEQKSLISEIELYHNLIVLQTLSKAWGMAGLRLGLAFATNITIQTLSQIKYPYNINGLTQKIVIEKLRKPIDNQVSEIIEERKKLISQLDELEIVKHIYPSDANFILVRFDNPKNIYSQLITNGIIVRDRSSIAGCENCLRITIGTPTENARTFETLKKLNNSGL